MNNPKILLVDLDDTLYRAEDPFMGEGWNHILAGFGWVWKTYGKEAGEMKVVSEEQRPGVGVNTRAVIRHFISELGLKLEDISETRLSEVNFLHRMELLRLKGMVQTDNELSEKLVEVLERERVDFLIEMVRREGVISNPEAVKMVKRFRESGYGIGIVTQSPLILARAILDSIGLRDYDEGPPRKINNSPTIVSGRMVTRPKPHPDPLQKAFWIITWNGLSADYRDELKQQISLSRENRAWRNRDRDDIQYSAALKAGLQEITRLILPDDWRPIGMVGDSGSDVRASLAYKGADGQPLPVVIIRTAYTNEGKLREIGHPAMVITENANQITPELFDSLRPSLEGQIFPSGLERQR